MEVMGKLNIRLTVAFRRGNEIHSKRVVVHSAYCTQEEAGTILEKFRYDNPGMNRDNLMATFTIEDYLTI